MKLLVITQDLRVSGTSAGIGKRSFLIKLKKMFPDSVMDIIYVSHFAASNNDELETLPVDSVIRKTVNNKIPFHIKWINRFTTRAFDFLYAEHYIHQKYAKHIKQIDYQLYDNIFIWSSGLSHETILASHGLPLLKKAVVIFHDPYPFNWYKTTSSNIHKNEFLRLKKMIAVVQQAKTCCATAYFMAKDLQFLYASNKNFQFLPHCFDAGAFNLKKIDLLRKKEAKFQISYHGALMFGRNPFSILEAYTQLTEEDQIISDQTEFVLRIKGERLKELKQKFGNVKNIKILETLDFSNSFNEQVYESDLNIILENGPHYCNILSGKVPFLASIGKPIFITSPKRSELRRILKDNPDIIADMNDVDDIKLKLGRLINLEINNMEPVYPFGDYFSDDNFNRSMDVILKT